MSKQFATQSKAKLILENPKCYWIDFVCEFVVASVHYHTARRVKINNKWYEKMFITLLSERKSQRRENNVMWIRKEQHQQDYPSRHVIVSTESTQLALRLFFPQRKPVKSLSLFLPRASWRAEFITIILMQIESFLMDDGWKGWGACYKSVAVYRGKITLNV